MRKNTLNAEQGHGKTWEGFCKSLYYGGSDQAAKLDAIFDVEKGIADDNLPVSIKSAKGGVIGLADACKHHAITEPYTILVGRYVQKGDWKEFYEVQKWTITTAIHKKLWGDISATEVRKFHESLKEGSISDARKAAKQHRKNLKQQGKPPIIALNPKINKDQRRLQCSITIKRLTEIAGEPESFTDEYLGAGLPRYKSPKRSFQ